MFASVGFINTMISSVDPQSYTEHHELFVIYPGPDIDVVNPLDTKFSSCINQNSTCFMFQVEYDFITSNLNVTVIEAKVYIRHVPYS